MFFPLFFYCLVVPTAPEPVPTIPSIVGGTEIVWAKVIRITTQINAHADTAAMLCMTTHTCFCGVLFDLESAPNNKAPIKEVDIPQPQPNRFDLPTKIW